MSADLTKPFAESCCDGGACAANTQSAQPCGCDPGCKNYKCEQHRGQPVAQRDEQVNQQVRQFQSGATRNTADNKHDYEGFFNPAVVYEFGRYMHSHRRQRDGSLRDSDNWQKGIPFAIYVKSLLRHTLDFWRLHRGYTVIDPDTGIPATKQELLCAIMFNAMGYLKELLDPAGENRIEIQKLPKAPHEQCAQSVGSSLPGSDSSGGSSTKGLV